MTRRAILLTLIWTLSTLVGCGGADAPQAPDLLKQLREKHDGGSRISALSEGGSDQARRAAARPSRGGAVRPRAIEEVKLITPAMLEADYPVARYITGVGYTERVDLNQAMLNAKERVAASISSEIESEITVKTYARGRRVGGRRDSESGTDQAQQTVERVRFKRAELIEIDARRTGCDARRCVAVAYVERRALARDALEAFEPLAARHQRLARECLRLASAGDLGGFAERFAQLERVAQRLKPLGAELEVILGEAEFGDRRAQRKLRAQVEMDRESLIAGAPLILDARGVEPTALREAVLEVFREDLIALGALARPSLGGDDPCEAQARGALLVRMRGDLERSSLSGIKIYSLPYHVTVESCAARRPLARFKLGLRFSVPDNTTLERSAREKLRLTAEKTRARLYDALHLTLPLKLPSADSM